METAHPYIGLGSGSGLRVGVKGQGWAFLLSNHSMCRCTHPSQISGELRMEGHAP